MKRVRGVLLCLLMGLAAAGCVSGKPHLESLNELQSGDIVLVGRIELVPPLNPKEQRLDTATSGRFRGMAHALVSDRRFDLDDLPISAGSHALFVELGKDYYIRQPRQSPLYYSGSLILLRSSASYSGYMNRNVTIDHGQIKLPGKLKYVIPPGARAVYLGTLRYHRNDYNAITRTEYIDDYARASREFARRFGGRVELQKVSPQRAP